jgi:hypothetical protein
MFEVMVDILFSCGRAIGDDLKNGTDVRANLARPAGGN